MTRKRELSFFKNIQSDEDFENFLDQKFLIVLDVYQELYGPCLSLQSTLERKKISLSNSDSLQLATCNANKIEKLERFRKNCYPTIVFCFSKKVVDISYGPNIPQLQKMIDLYVQLLDDETKLSELPLYEFEELLPMELKAIEQQLKDEAERIHIENELAQAEKLEALDRIIDLMSKNSSDMGITLFMPHVAKNAFRKTHETAKWLSLANRAEKMIQITPDMMEVLNYNLENPIDERILEQIFDKDIFAVLWYTDPRNSITDVIQEFIRLTSEPQERVTDEGEVVWQRILEPLIIDPCIDEENVEVNSQNDLETDENVEYTIDDADHKSIASNEMTQQEEIKNSSEEKIEDNLMTENVSDELSQSGSGIEIEDTRIIIPPVWAPTNQPGNAMFMHKFFRNQFESYLPPIVEPEPPHLCLIFPAKIRGQVMEICEEYPNDLLDYGFYDGDDFENFQPICKTLDSFENLISTGKEKMILKVSKRTSLLALDLVKLNPLYISQNVEDGQEECNMIFNEISENESVN